ncbi:uncharacterized protein LOC113372233 [Ctenocephalides felis]|uniref:uncharacterized protein LOC113372233 n=1 Tax=Ctenocephalides felis TaxID=7515 RepID=UPI000E6E1E0A|nr:uncharacterized protein LOC113372233 [Ctenocephalides felis]
MSTNGHRMEYIKYSLRNPSPRNAANQWEASLPYMVLQCTMFNINYCTNFISFTIEMRLKNSELPYYQSFYLGFNNRHILLYGNIPVNATYQILHVTTLLHNTQKMR